MIEGLPDWFTIPVLLLAVVGGWGLIGAMFERFRH